jgi:hypothetical protein
MLSPELLLRHTSRRRFLGAAGVLGTMAAAAPAWANAVMELPLPGGPDERLLTTAFPQKRAMILQRTRSPLLETPFEVFDCGISGTGSTPTGPTGRRLFWRRTGATSRWPTCRPTLPN